MKFQYRPRGVCSQLMDIEVENGRIVNVDVMGGCPGNLQGISRLLKGMSVDDAIERMEGIRCGMKKTSCPDQFGSGLQTDTRWGAGINLPLCPCSFVSVSAAVRESRRHILPLSNTRQS